MKLKFPDLLKPLGNIIQQNYLSFYPSELIYFALFTMRHPVIVHFNIQKLKNKHNFIKTEKAKSSHFDRTRGDKKQIFPT